MPQKQRKRSGYFLQNRGKCRPEFCGTQTLLLSKPVKKFATDKDE